MPRLTYTKAVELKCCRVCKRVEKCLDAICDIKFISECCFLDYGYCDPLESCKTLFRKRDKLIRLRDYRRKVN
jgi:hypothetical protein